MLSAITKYCLYAFYNVEIIEYYFCNVEIVDYALSDEKIVEYSFCNVKRPWHCHKKFAAFLKICIKQEKEWARNLSHVCLQAGT